MDLHSATDDDIIQHCSRSNPDRNVISELEGGHSVIKISDNAVVKRGMGVTEMEAINQQQAYETLKEIVRIPQVYRFFRSGFIGYLIMEYINGQPVSSMPDPDIHLEAIAKVLKLFEHVQREKPGPFYQGFALGQLWLDDHPIAPATISDIEEYYNSRQLKDLTHLDLTGYPLVLCHLDIAPRNILVLEEDSSLCLIDWSSAGFYPRFFERLAIDINIRKEDDWNSKLLGRLNELDESEKSQLHLLERAYYLGQRYV